MKRYILIIIAATYKYLPRWGDSFLERYFMLLSIDLLLLFGVISTVLEDIFGYKYIGFLKDSGNPLVIILRLIIAYIMLYIIEFFLKRFFYANEIEIKQIQNKMDKKTAKRITLLFQLVIWIIFMVSIFFHSEKLNPWK